MTVDARQAKAINIIIVMVTTLTAVVGVLAYLENKKHAKINDEVLRLDKEIKILELAKKKNELRQMSAIA